MAQRLDRQAADGVRAQFAEGQQPDLGEGPLGAPGGGPAEGACVVRGVGQVERGAVEAHQPPAAVEGPDGLVGGHGAGGLEEQLPQRRDAEPAPGLGEGRVGGLGLVAGRMEPAPDLGDGVGGEQGHGDDQPDDGVGGETRRRSDDRAVRDKMAARRCSGISWDRPRTKGERVLGDGAHPCACDPSGPPCVLGTGKHPQNTKEALILRLTTGIGTNAINRSSRSFLYR